MEEFASSGKRNKADHQPAEHDALEEEAWQRDIAGVANALGPTMVLMFMRAGAYGWTRGEIFPFIPLQSHSTRVSSK